MSVRSDVSQLAPMEMVEMFVFSDANIGGTHTFRWHSGTRPAGNFPIVWQGVTYEPFPIEANGFDVVATDKLPRPTLRCSNIGGSMGAYLRSIQDALGATVTRKRTLGKYLDAVNFPGGNPNADPDTYFPDELYYVSRKASETVIQWAAAQVPEYMTLIPAFDPALRPLTIKSGRSGKSSISASLTQSAGRPSTAHPIDCWLSSNTS